MFDELDIDLLVVMALCGVIMFVMNATDAMIVFIVATAVFAIKGIVEWVRTKKSN